MTHPSPVTATPAGWPRSDPAGDCATVSDMPPKKLCIVCEGPVSAAGRKSRTGVYYCSKVECRRERDRARAQRWRAGHSPAPVSALSSSTRVALELELEKVRRAGLVELRAALLDGGLTIEEIDEQFPLPA